MKKQITCEHHEDIAKCNICLKKAQEEIDEIFNSERKYQKDSRTVKDYFNNINQEKDGKRPNNT